MGEPLSKTIRAIITDVEMHSSLSASENLRLGMKVGADACIAKLQPAEFSRELDKLLNAA